MKTYIKIFIITLAIQVGFSLLKFLMINNINIHSNIIFVCVVMKYLVSFLVDVILSLLWGKNKKEKFVCIFFMLTNYTWLISVLFISSLIEAFLDEMTKLPDNFGSNIIGRM